MREKTKTSLRIIIGIFLIVFGLAGMILPILPGWWVALFGLHLLGWRLVINPSQPWFKKYRIKRERTLR